jgi:hypothetical protein
LSVIRHSRSGFLGGVGCQKFIDLVVRANAEMKRLRALMGPNWSFLYLRCMWLALAQAQQSRGHDLHTIRFLLAA